MIDSYKIVDGTVNGQKKMIEIHVFENKTGKYLSLDDTHNVITISLENISNELKHIVRK